MRRISIVLSAKSDVILRSFDEFQDIFAKCSCAGLGGMGTHADLELVQDRGVQYEIAVKTRKLTYRIADERKHGVEKTRGGDNGIYSHCDHRHQTQGQPAATSH